MPQIPRGSSLLTRAGSGSTPGILPGAPTGGIPVVFTPFAGQHLNPATGKAYIDPVFAPYVEEQFSLFDQLGKTDIQPLQAQNYAPIREEFTQQLARYLEQQNMGGTKQLLTRGRGGAHMAPTGQLIPDPEAIAQTQLLGQSARAALTGLRTEPVRFRAKGGLITRRRNVV